MDDAFSYEGFELVDIKTGEYTPVDKNGKPIIHQSPPSVPYPPDSPPG